VTSLEVDLSQVRSAREVHAVFAAALRFPDWYGHNWDAFWDLISSDCPLPEHLSIRGFDHVERTLPREAELLLTCLADYNSAERLCRVSVTDDYQTRMFFMSYEARPAENAGSEDAIGAIINCWVKADSAREANQIARREIKADGWDIVSQEDFSPVELDLAQEDRDSVIRQACIDGTVFELHTWSSDVDDE
jgi:RNAse (barnase) inhibitor barstar